MNTDMKSCRFDSYHVLPDSPQMQKDFLYVLASLYAKSSAPEAQDVLRVAKINNILPVNIEGFEQYPDRGIGGLVKLPDEQRPRAVLIGTQAFLSQCGLETPAILEVTVRKWQTMTNSYVVLVGWDGWVRGVLKFVRDIQN
jgi:cation transport ATPase